MLRTYWSTLVLDFFSLDMISFHFESNRKMGTSYLGWNKVNIFRSNEGLIRFCLSKRSDCRINNPTVITLLLLLFKGKRVESGCNQLIILILHLFVVAVLCDLLVLLIAPQWKSAYVDNCNNMIQKFVFLLLFSNWCKLRSARLDSASQEYIKCQGSGVLENRCDWVNGKMYMPTAHWD